MKVFAAITKVDAATRTVYGRACQETPDRTGEIFDYATSAPLFKAWSGRFEKTTGGASLGNVRAMHGKTAAGKLTAIEFDDASKAIDICAKIIDDNEWEKVIEGVYTGFSIGGKYVPNAKGEKLWKDATNPELKRYTCDPSEISIVDDPCVPSALFTMVKLNGESEQRPFSGNAKKFVIKQAWTCAISGHEHKEKRDAENCITSVERTLLSGVSVPNVREEFAKALNVDLSKLATPKPQSEWSKLAGAILAAGSSAGSAVGFDVAKRERAVEKGLWTVGRFAEALSDLISIQSSVDWEAESEGDGSTLPARIKSLCQLAGDILVDMAREEVDEANAADPSDLATYAAYAMRVGDLAKAGARHNKGDKALLQTIHDHSVAMGAACGASEGEKAVTNDELKKMLASTDVNTAGALKAFIAEEVAKSVSGAVEQATKPLLEKITSQAGEVAKAISELSVAKAELDGFKAQLRDPKGIVKTVAVAKENDTAEPGKVEQKLDMEKATPLDLIKEARKHPVAVAV